MEWKRPSSLILILRDWCLTLKIDTFKNYLKFELSKVGIKFARWLLSKWKMRRSFVWAREGKKGKNLEGSRCRCYGGTDAFYGIAVQQMYGSNGASAGLPMGMTTLKSGGALGSLGTYGSALGSGVTGATTLPRPGNWLRPAGLRHGHSAARVRLYCQAKWGATVPTGNAIYLFILCIHPFHISVSFSQIRIRMRLRISRSLILIADDFIRVRDK